MHGFFYGSAWYILKNIKDSQGNIIAVDTVSSFKLTLKNFGTGPAIIQEFQIYVDDQKVDITKVTIKNVETEISYLYEAIEKTVSQLEHLKLINQSKNTQYYVTINRIHKTVFYIMECRKRNYLLRN